MPRTFIRPHSRLLGLVAVLVAMCYAGASQSNGAAYLLCFVLTSLVIVSTVHTWVNLNGLHISVEAISPVFVGNEVIVPVVVNHRPKRGPFGLRVRVGDGELVSSEDTPSASTRLEPRFAARQRGRYRSVSLLIASDYPLGFFTATQRIKVAQTYDIYPRPQGALPYPSTLSATRQLRDGVRLEGDDFGGVRLWRPGESQRHIDWKAAARNPTLLTKQWTGERDEILYFDWAGLPALDTEARLSQLARWIVSAERGLETYELRLPGQIVAAARGDRHYHECLGALAAYVDSASVPLSAP